MWEIAGVGFVEDFVLAERKWTVKLPDDQQKLQEVAHIKFLHREINN